MSTPDNASLAPSTTSAIPLIPRKFLARFRSNPKAESSALKDQTSASPSTSIPKNTGPVKDYEEAFGILATGMGFGGGVSVKNPTKKK